MPLFVLHLCNYSNLSGAASETCGFKLFCMTRHSSLRRWSLGSFDPWVAPRDGGSAFLVGRGSEYLPFPNLNLFECWSGKNWRKIDTHANEENNQLLLGARSIFSGWSFPTRPNEVLDNFWVTVLKKNILCWCKHVFEYFLSSFNPIFKQHSDWTSRLDHYLNANHNDWE